MTFPKENIWQELRQASLDAVPEGCSVGYASPRNFSDWREKGYYTVVAASSRQVTLLTTPREIGTVLLGEAEFLLDHALEHQVSIWRHVSSNGWTSAAWTVVTFYYWAFFLMMALTRMLGSTAVFLDKDAIRAFKRLAPNSSGKLGAGLFSLTANPSGSGTESEVSLRKKDSRIHDYVWRLWFERCSELLAQVALPSSSSLEQRVFTCLDRVSRNLGPDWPSVFRNAVNYRPGFAYDEIAGKRVLGTFAYTRGCLSLDDIVSRFENNTAAAHTRSSISGAPRLVGHLLVDLTFLLCGLALELHQELIERNGLDRRAAVNRKRFLQKQGLQTGDGVWPFRTNG